MTQLRRIRRGVGLILILAGLISLGEMIFASLYSMGRVPILVSARLWSELYYAQYLFMTLGGGMYLLLSFRQAGVFHYEALVDFIIAVGVFTMLLGLAGFVLVRELTVPWFSLLPGSFLVSYGAGLVAGRSFGFGKRSA